MSDPASERASKRTSKQGKGAQIREGDRTQFTFSYLKRFENVIKDVDGNGKWSTGNFSLKKPSEPTHYYNSPIEIKAGWDVDISWEF